MARQNKDFLMAWSSLLGDDTKEGWRYIPLQQSGSLQILAGRKSPDNLEAIFIGFSVKKISQKDDLPSGQGFSIECVELDESNYSWLVISRSLQGNVELFETMSYDVVSSLDIAAKIDNNEEKLYRLCLNRIRAWQEFMRKDGQILSPESEIGLFGELIFLKTLLDSGFPNKKIILDSWVGPLDRAQDFELGTGAIEVKSTISINRFQIKIGSLEQLDDSIRQPLYISAVRLNQVESGNNLSELVSSIKNLLSDDITAERIFTERLLEAGFFEFYSSLYIRKFKLIELKLIEVNNEFPRLLISNIPTAIIKASYEIDLDRVSMSQIDINVMLQKLGVS